MHCTVQFGPVKQDKNRIITLALHDIFYYHTIKTKAGVTEGGRKLYSVDKKSFANPAIDIASYSHDSCY
ncbi:MAG: hypothetical protein JXB88_08915 [Spirochaetales bacterium]|nr:hypothetical protein [Spirochaetales bacterium]